MHAGDIVWVRALDQCYSPPTTQAPACATSPSSLSLLSLPLPLSLPLARVFDCLLSFWFVCSILSMDPTQWIWSTQTFVTMNIPAGHPVGALSVGLYSIAIMMSYPLQLFPAVKCLEG